MAGAASSRQQSKLRKKLTRKERERQKELEEGPGKQTRRKRFLNPDEDFGKTSLVYQLKYGALKNEVPIDSLRPHVRPRPIPRDDDFRAELLQDTRGPEKSRMAHAFGSSEGGPRKNNQDDSQLQRQRSNRQSLNQDPSESSTGKLNIMDILASKRRLCSLHGETDSAEHSGGTRRWNEQQSGRDSRERRPGSHRDSAEHSGGTRRWNEQQSGRDPRARRRGNRRDSNRHPGRASIWIQQQGKSLSELRIDGDEGSDKLSGGSLRGHKQQPGGDLLEGRSTDYRDSAKRSKAARRMMPMTIKYTTAASQFVYGRSAVKAALDGGRRKVYNLYICGGAETHADRLSELQIARLATRKGANVTLVPRREQRLMDKMSAGRPHNGFVLEASPVQQMPVLALGQVEDSEGGQRIRVTPGHQTREDEDINSATPFFARSSSRTPQPLVLMLHEIIDPGNLGALIRTASYLGVDAVGITNRSSATLTPVALKSAAGAAEEVTLFTVPEPAEFLEQSRSAGWVAYAAVQPPGEKLARMHSDKFLSTDDIERRSPLLDKPCILVLGNEGHGLPREVKVAADYELSVPRVVFKGCVDSLNVSVAGALLTHAFVKGAMTKETKTETETQTEKAKEAESAGDDAATVAAPEEGKEEDQDRLF
ncbi:RNA methyltransferase, TrmH family [Beauveria brongniartii RCEF 3172]|uniref:rRNA methyltransferase 1, mitochondrial n=1 Tax=Beauveria brongniartii RCEF 3172 TaxID=1081107 RepID=A0A166ZJI5_9HYPO|nr:RNA methyltransferase, TrmH family [Beauveria brongniartii RCEF 3172]